MAKKEALGRGLGALLSNSGEAPRKRPAFPPKSEAGEPEVVGNMAGSIALIPIADIEANPDQPRREFDPDRLNELADSIRELGIIQPLTVHKVRANKYQIISGERRFRASQLAGLNAVPAYIREADDQTLLEMALVENIQREDLHAIEVAMSLQRLIQECQLTHEKLGERIGKPRATITHYIGLLNLPEVIQLAVASKEISFGHAKALNIPDKAWQLEVFRLIHADTLSVRQTEALAKEGPAQPGTRPSKKALLSFDEQKVDADLQKRFGKLATLKSKGNGAGKIEISYRNADDLDRILQLMDL